MQSSQPSDLAHDRYKERLLDTHQVAQRLNISERQVQRLAELGELKGRKIGKLWRFREKDVDDFLQGNWEVDPLG